MRKIILCTIVLLINLPSNAQTWDKVKKIVSSDRTVSNEFGNSVSISGNYAIVGVENEDEDATGGNPMIHAGSAYFYERDNNGQWIEKQKIIASDRTAYDLFGCAVSLNGNYAIIGAYAEDHDASGGIYKSGAGSAYIFKRGTNGVWTQVQKIVASDRTGTNYFGFSVSISDKYAIVGAKYNSYDTSGGNTLSSAGSAYIYERNISGTWIEVKKITANDRGSEDYFGTSVSISNTRAIVGAHYAKGMNSLVDAGSAYIFERNLKGVWYQVSKIVATDGETNDEFGNSVAICGDYAIIGASNEDEDSTGKNSLASPGSSYIFERNSNGIWTQVKKIVASDRASLAYFGSSVSIEGNKAFIGAPGFKVNTSSSKCGAAYIFIRNNSGSWYEAQKLTAPDFDAGDEFGGSVSNSGDYFIVGAQFDEDSISGGNKITDAGSIYIFEPCDTRGAISFVGCTEYISPSNKYTYTVSGVYQDTLINYFGCDSIITINLTINYSTSNEFSETICDQYVSPSGKYIWKSSNTYEDTIQNYKGCDSIITIHLTVNKSSVSSVNVENCIHYLSPSKKYLWTKSGNYTDTIANTSSCDSIIAINLNITTVDTSVIQNGATLTANAQNATFQWLDCNKAHTMIFGETAKTFIATTNGVYAVEIKENGCIDTSYCITVSTIDVMDNDFSSEFHFSIYYSQGFVIIDLGNMKDVSLNVFSICGQLMYHQENINTSIHQIDLKDAHGVYIVEVNWQGIKQYYKLVYN